MGRFSKLVSEWIRPDLTATESAWPITLGQLAVATCENSGKTQLLDTGFLADIAQSDIYYLTSCFMPLKLRHGAGIYCRHHGIH
ncbi:hypothetical protein HCB18_05775 [Salinispora arenicola]|nr:hypothetical protein [Salinispora arenicola]